MTTVEPDTINKKIADVIARYPQRPALSARDGKQWKTLTYAQIGNSVRRFSLGLRGLGIERGDRVALLSENRPEWAIVDIATLAAGAVTVPIYPTLPPAQVAYILSDSGARAIVVSDKKQLEKVTSSLDSAPNLKFLITLEPGSPTGNVLTFDDVLKAGDANRQASESFEQRRDSVLPDDLMSLVYTSGTTGNPKGAMLTHKNMASAIDGAYRALPFDPPNDVFLSFLPLCHVFERVTYCLALMMGAHTYYNDKISRLRENIPASRPTVMQCVPRVFESIHEGVLDNIAKLPDWQKRLTEAALEVGAAYAMAINHHKSPGPLLSVQHWVLDKLALSKIRSRFGGRLRFFVSGGAPLALQTATFFHALGIPILEGWGLTETTAASTVNPYHRARIGTVGRPDFGAEVKIAGDGEVLVRGPHVMQGYWNHPDATAVAIDSDGWFYTGDIGELDSEGYLKITDRKKDIIVMANGKKVAPQPIETMLKHSPYISEIVLLGDSSGTVMALVVPELDKLAEWASQAKIEFDNPEQLAQSAEARKFIKSEIDRLSTHLADFEKIKRLALLDHKLSIESGELTPTLKVRRKEITQRYGSLLAG